MAKIALVVDDSLVIRRMVKQTLEALGFETLEAGDGRQALETAQKAALSLVVTDLNMPVMNGIEFIRELRCQAAHKFTPIVFLTTEMDAGLRDEARAAGATAWVNKPFHPDKIVTVVKKIAA